MLSFDTVHAITDQLLAATAADLDAGVLTQPPTLLLLDDHRSAPISPLVRMLPIPLATGTADRLPLPHPLHDTAKALSLRGAAHPIMRAVRAVLTDAAGAGIDRRVLAWAVRYDDIDLTTGVPQPVRRVDAVDLDGRVYQLSLRHAETSPVIHVDDDPHAAPATTTGLADLLTVTSRLTSTGVRA